MIAPLYEINKIKSLREQGKHKSFIFWPKGERWMEIDCIVIHESSSYSGFPIKSAALHNKGALFFFP